MPGKPLETYLSSQIREIELDAPSQEDLDAVGAMPNITPQDPRVNSILSYLRQRGYQFVSYDRIRSRIDPTLTDDILDGLVRDNRSTFRPAKLKDGKHGLGKLVP